MYKKKKLKIEFWYKTFCTSSDDMLRSCLCCCPVRRRGLTKNSSRGRSSLLQNDTVTAVGPPTKFKYKFHNSIVVRHKRNKKRKKLFMNRTMFVVPTYVPPGTPTAIIEWVQTSMVIHLKIVFKFYKKYLRICNNKKLLRKILAKDKSDHHFWSLKSATTISRDKTRSLRPRKIWKSTSH